MTPSPSLTVTSDGSETSLDRLRALIEHAGELLPAQGPINVFIHHNTLHAFEDLPFDEGVQKGARIFGCQPYLSEDRYRDELVRGRILSEDLYVVLREDLGPDADHPVLSFCTRFELRLARLQHSLRFGPAAELLWFVAETDALKRMRSEVSSSVRERVLGKTRHWIMRDVRTRGSEGSNGASARQSRQIHDLLSDIFESCGESTIESWSAETWEAFTLQTLWRICREGVRHASEPASVPPLPGRPRDGLLDATGVDIDLLVHSVLIRFCAAYLDQGFAHWHLPNREQGFFRAFVTLYRQPVGPPDRWLRGLADELSRLDDAHIGPLESIQESLDILGIPEPEWHEFISATLLALRGWAGMIRQVELRSDSVAHQIASGSLIDFLSIRLILERFALSHVARESLGYDGPLADLRQIVATKIAKRETPTVEQRAFLVFQLAQILGWSPDELHHLSPTEWNRLVEELEAFTPLERRRVFHLAFERRFYTRTLDALAIHAWHGPDRYPSPRFQAMFCLDEREESFRRHLEEVAGDVETFSAAGFYSVAMYYRGAEDAHFTPLCPIVIRPQHWVVETVVEDFEETHRQRVKARRALGTATHQMHVGSRSFAGGALLTAGLGLLASIPLVARILFPRLTGEVRKTASRLVRAPETTELQFERTAATPGPQEGHVGFTVDEMTNIAERLLRDIGLTSGFAPLVLVIGHGSNSLNNPHNSAYNCGACGGGAGGPNARTLARILNDPRIRNLLIARDIAIPDGTWFVGGFHNTCNDAVSLLDVDRIPESHRVEFEAAQKAIELTCDRNAHERCRRFQSAPLTMSFSAARRHVETRSEDLSQTRPECGHATNAICIVGRRTHTRGLFLDRRAFLTSYDPTQDDADSSILARILAAAVPVCAGINLEYYFSYVDNTGFGCGAKLPHNVTALLGVMDGAASDLRTGLPWQMVEIHEPVRLLFVIETTPERMLSIMDRNPGIGILVRHAWIHLAVLDTESHQIQVFRNGEFKPYRPEAIELPQAASSADWYRGWRDHLEFAQIEPSEDAELKDKG
ncbi:MAG: DUF2309 domain-containing protein [Planctomycetota bacterium]